jgi:hypothetical protein
VLGECWGIVDIAVVFSGGFCGAAEAAGLALACVVSFAVSAGKGAAAACGFALAGAAPEEEEGAAFAVVEAAAPVADLE